MKILLTAYIVSIYLVPLSMLASLPVEAVGVLLVLSVIIGFINFIYAFFSKSENKYGVDNRLKLITIAKLALIPFYIVHTGVFTGLFLASANPFLMWTWFTVIPLAILYACGIFIVTSVYAVKAIIGAAKEGGVKNAAVYCVLQFIIILDIPSCVYLCLKKYKPHFGKKRRILLTLLPVLIPVFIFFIGGVVEAVIPIFTAVIRALTT